MAAVLPKKSDLEISDQEAGRDDHIFIQREHGVPPSIW